MNYYNENSPQEVGWLRELIRLGRIPPGDVDDRSIEDVVPSEIKGYTQHHFFAGIGGWSYALELAGWPRKQPVFTGSCPCQPFSKAGSGGGFSDKRHLWPAWFHIIRELAPTIIFGEQVGSAIRSGWLDLVFSDLEDADYSVGSAILGAHTVGAPHQRQRLYFVGDSERHRLRISGRTSPIVPDKSGHRALLRQLRPWTRFERTLCNDGSTRKIERGIMPLVDGVSRDMVPSRNPVTEAYTRNTPEVRTMRIRGYGNAVCPQTAAAFVTAYLATRR
jgi:DNA (cytosine-5)-methyltransferase 1